MAAVYSNGSANTMLIGYARVSKPDGTQLLDLQRDALIAADIEEERIYEDRTSGRHDHRPGLEACLKALQPDNTFVVWKPDRLGRNLKHLVTTNLTMMQRQLLTGAPQKSRSGGAVFVDCAR